MRKILGILCLFGSVANAEILMCHGTRSVECNGSTCTEIEPYKFDLVINDKKCTLDKTTDCSGKAYTFDNFMIIVKSALIVRLSYVAPVVTLIVPSESSEIKYYGTCKLVETQ